jgi:hypothetical protein
MERTTHELIIDVMDGNPGAFTIIRSLMAYPTWLQLLVHLKQNDLVGSELWRIVKDEYGHNIVRFIDDQLDAMSPERASTLRALTLQKSPIYN